ncbi:GNAT family N-acetyltransferase [Aquamicrobium sp. LC103]|uniref:GNAT family N-acetyltransferase n=1 Tax=Aquamicrobium sp. LC103 TaxID=1120658 RepID=UPI00063E9D81|nr:GNAT family N-acetyltransferase [Aquamicrobium sp. LC103]TKT82844.1 GNAT family N-acetyltransferase [Aquamicrobium sp. LC103]
MNRTPAAIRILTRQDVEACRRLRLAGLAESPQSFGASVEEEARLSDDEIEMRVAPPPPGAMFGAFAGRELVGMAGYVPNQRIKMRHKATMVAVYVVPQWRGSGSGRALVEAVMEHARGLGVILQCTVAAHNQPARRLYRKLGFQPYGLERDALLIDGQYFDEELLAIDLRPGR